MRRCQRGRDRQITRERPAPIKPKVSARYRFVERFQVSAGHAEGVIKSRLPKTAEARIYLERGSRPICRRKKRRHLWPIVEAMASTRFGSICFAFLLMRVAIWRQRLLMELYRF